MGVSTASLRSLASSKRWGLTTDFALAGQHARWELNDLARRLDKQPAVVELMEALLPILDSGAARVRDGGGG
jgi:RNA polymerase sigma-70 factor (ECF subfamily)